MPRQELTAQFQVKDLVQIYILVTRKLVSKGQGYISKKRRRSTILICWPCSAAVILKLETIVMLKLCWIKLLIWT